MIKRNGIIQFSIAERDLLPYGEAILSTDTWRDNIVWKVAQQFNVSDNHTRNGIDYHTLTWENRSVNLDTVTVPVGQVVTGVRFNRNHAGHLILEVRATEIDLEAGKLINIENSMWLSNSMGGKHRINTDNLDISTKANKPPIPNFKENTYVRFGPTHRKVDISQRTVPFIDTTRVESKVPIALSGISLYYKGQTGYGGFIAPRIIVYDFNTPSEKTDE